MIKIFVWQVSPNSFKNKAVEILKRQHNGIEIVGSANDEEINKVDRKDYDILLVVGARGHGDMGKVIQVARQLNLPEEKLLGDWIVCIPGFTLEKYRRLQRSRVSIFASNCFGGNLSNKLGLPFLSPLVNIGWYEDNFIRFLKNPKEYIKITPTFREQKINPETGKKHNFANLGDLWISILHYDTFEEFFVMWEKRKTRINWDNIFVTTYTQNIEELEQFDALPYDKKACFVPFKSDLNSAYYVNMEKYKDFGLTFGFTVLHFTTGLIPPPYDFFDMLLGKKTQLIDM